MNAAVAVNPIGLGTRSGPQPSCSNFMSLVRCQGLVGWSFGLVSSFETTTVTSKVVETTESVENVIPLPDQERASDYAHFSLGNIPSLSQAIPRPLPDESLDSDGPFHQHRRRGNHRTTRRFDIDA